MDYSDFDWMGFMKNDFTSDLFMDGAEHKKNKIKFLFKKNNLTIKME